MVDDNSEVESSQQEEEACLSKQSSLQEENSEQANIGPTLPPLSTIKKNDVRLYLTATKAGVKTIHVEEKQHGLQDETKIDKMKMIREKMTESRKRNEAQEIRNAILVRRRRVEKPTQWNGEDLVYAEDVGNEMVQDEVDLVVVGADVEALYPSLTDLEVAQICYEAIMNSKIKFQNVNHRKARMYIALNMSKSEQRMSSLHRVLSKRTAKGGVRLGVTADPEKEENCVFPPVELTELEERMIVATVVKIGVIAQMNTHVYTFDGEMFLQKAGGPIGLRSTCAVARITMSTWDAS